MSQLTINLPDHIRALAETRATEAGCADVSEYVSLLIRAEAAGAPVGLEIDSDEQVEALLLTRRDGPFVEMDDADLKQIRQKVEAQLGSAQDR